MVGLVISDKFLLTGSWVIEDGVPSLLGISEIPFTEPILNLLHDETELNTVLASSLRQAKEANPFAGDNIYST